PARNHANMATGNREVQHKVTDYANPDVLVTTTRVEENQRRPGPRPVEENEDVQLYETGHTEGADTLDWHTELHRSDVRDFIGEKAFAELMEEEGISDSGTVVFYGDKSNWWAAYAFWFFRYNGHADLNLMDGGRAKWQAEGRKLV